MTRLTAVTLVATVLLPACANNRRSPPHELARIRAGAVDVVVLSPAAALSAGRATFTLEFRRPSDGALVDVGPVKASAMMPMAGMSPMFGPVDARPSGVAGRYVTTAEFSMPGDWRLAFEWDGPAGPGSATFSPAVN